MAWRRKVPAEHAVGRTIGPGCGRRLLDRRAPKGSAAEQRLRILAPCLLTILLAGTAQAAPVGRDADLRRSGWYPDQPGLSPQVVSSGSFGQLFSTPVVGQVYGQPLVFQGTLLATTQANWIYGLDPVTGAVLWSRNVGTPWNSSDLGCADISPVIGITATPVIDDATGIAYFTSKSYDDAVPSAGVWTLHAVAVASGDEQPGFPVTIAGTADNEPGQTFDPTTELQRPGLLLMDGVVYAAFSGICDHEPFQGWVVGVSTAGVITCMWVDRSGSGTSGGGIWMSGSALASDAPGQILLVTGNGLGGGTPSVPTPGHSPPADLGESVVRLSVQVDGSLRATDFFTPFNANTVLDPNDGDLGSGGVVGLPYPLFGTAAFPDLLVQVGKEGIVYLLDGASLGGYQQGAGGGDQVIQESGPYGGVFSKPAVWGGDGGWVYIPSASTVFPPDEIYGYLRAYQEVDSAGAPALALGGTAADPFGFASSAPIVTSSGTTSGSALVWIVWNPDRTGVGAQLRAYDALPVNGVLDLRFSALVGEGSKFNPPGVAGGRIYVGTRDGHVIGFGLPDSVLAVADDRACGACPGLRAAYPNPSSGRTTVELALAEGGRATLAVYDLSGRRVRRLVEGEVAAGTRRVVWEGRDEAGESVPAGLYLLRLEAGGARQTRRVMVVR
jgi:outer membrane protein assembly factor BamB